VKKPESSLQYIIVEQLKVYSLLDIIVIHHTLISSPKTTAANVKKHCRNVPLVNSIRICELGIDL
jgi:hypothetical protein